jgi:hypothetical protein
MRKRYYLPSVSPEEISNSTFPVFARFYFDNLQGNSPYYKDGAIPFFVKFFDPTDEDILNIIIRKQENRRVAKGYLFDKFHIYKIADYGSQSLSPTFDDMIVFVFDENGFKIPIKNIVMIKNFTMKQAFIVIPKASFTSGGDVSIIIEPRNFNRKVFDLGTAITESNNEFSIYMNTRNIDNLNTLQLYVKESNGDFYFLSNSSYFIEKVREKFPSEPSSDTFVEEQGSYFIQAEKNFQNKTESEKNKIYPSHKITINPGILTPGKTIHIVSTEHFDNYYYNSAGFFKNNNSFTDIMRKCTVCDVFKETASGQVKLITGYDFYLTDNNSLAFNASAGVTNDTMIEVYVRKDVNARLLAPFSTAASGEISFSLKKFLYDNYIGNWDVNVSSSFVTVFEDGKLVGDHEFDEYLNGKNYQYVIEDVNFSSNTTDISGDSNLGLTPLYDESYSQTQFNKYQISTDPYLISYGGVFEFNEQEVYLYDDSLNFKIHELEPYITDSSGLTIQGITDPYPTFLTTVQGNYEDFQSVYLEEKTKLTHTLHNNEKVQAIETQISQLKKNLNAILVNSNVSYQTYTASSTVNSGNFMFLVLKGVIGGKFTLAYKDSQDNIVKKEYNCTFDSNGRYISLPFFLDTFDNNESSIRFQIIEGSVQQYHIFK